MISLIKKSRVHTIARLKVWLTDWKEKQRERHMPHHPQRFDRVRDLVACIYALCGYCETTNELLQKIDRLFTDTPDEHKLVCSTVHRAKGLERERVWMLSATFGYPVPKPWQDVWSEENIWYVAVTRAKTDLRFVETPLTDIMGGSLVRRRRNVAWRT
jgi:DNA helicase-2/ATP-dependent DNA helicase PcrA